MTHTRLTLWAVSCKDEGHPVLGTSVGELWDQEERVFVSHKSEGYAMGASSLSEVSIYYLVVL